MHSMLARYGAHIMLCKCNVKFSMFCPTLDDCHSKTLVVKQTCSKLMVLFMLRFSVICHMHFDVVYNLMFLSFWVGFLFPSQLWYSSLTQLCFFFACIAPMISQTCDCLIFWYMYAFKELLSEWMHMDTYQGHVAMKYGSNMMHPFMCLFKVRSRGKKLLRHSHNQHTSNPFRCI